MKDISIGTSGYYYKDWESTFYPEGTPKEDFLSYYSEFFKTVELNFTYYCIPSVSSIYSILDKSVPGFVFSLKANKVFTHKRQYSDKELSSFKNSLSPLSESKKLGSLLFQFPYSFKFNYKNLDYLRRIRSDFEQIDICVEFRNVYWLNDKVLSLLEAEGIGFCNVDQPSLKGLLPPTDISFGGLGYIRFHGRNAKYWWDNEKAYQRYDYMYKKEELKEWIPRIKKIKQNSKKTYIYFNNHYKAKAPRSAQLLISILTSHNNTSQN